MFAYVSQEIAEFSLQLPHFSTYEPVKYNGDKV